MHFVSVYIDWCRFSITSLHPHILLAYFLGPNTPVDLPTGKDLSKIYSQSIPSAAAVKQETLLPPEGAVLPQEGEAETSEPVKNNLTEDKEMEVMDVHGEDTQTEGTRPWSLKALVFFISIPAFSVERWWHLRKLTNNLLTSPEADPVMDGMLMSRVKVEDAPLSQKPEEPEDYDADEQVVGGVDLEKQRRSKLAENIGMWHKVVFVCVKREQKYNVSCC